MKNIGRFLFIAAMSLLPASVAAIASTADGAKSFFSSAEGKFGNGDYQGAIADDNKAIARLLQFKNATTSTITSWRF